MNRLVLLVEGDGEVEAAPLLIERILYEYFNRHDFQRSAVMNAHGRGNILSEGALERFLEMARREGVYNGLLILLDNEDRDQNCPRDLARQIANRTINLNLPFPAAIVCPTCQYESWFLASLSTLANTNDLPPDIAFEGPVEEVSNPKRWLTDHMPGPTKYREVIHQTKMSARLDLLAVEEKSRSFRRLLHAVEELIQAIDAQTSGVTPPPE